MVLGAMPTAFGWACEAPAQHEIVISGEGISELEVFGLNRRASHAHAVPWAWHKVSVFFPTTVPPTSCNTLAHKAAPADCTPWAAQRPRCVVSPARSFVVRCAGFDIPGIQLLRPRLKRAPRTRDRSGGRHNRTAASVRFLLRASAFVNLARLDQNLFLVFGQTILPLLGYLLQNRIQFGFQMLVRFLVRGCGSGRRDRLFMIDA